MGAGRRGGRTSSSLCELCVWGGSELQRCLIDKPDSFPCHIDRFLSRFLRWLFKAEGILLQEPSEAWQMLAVMGAGAVKGLTAAGISSYEEAEAACVHLRSLRAASGASYEVDDLVCFLCLATHAEAVPDCPLPDVAPRISVELDLGTSAQVPLSRPTRSLATSQPLVRIRCKTKQHASVPTRRLTISQPLVRIWRKTKPDATMSSILVFVLHELLGWVANRGAASLCHCSRDFHGGGLYMTRRARQKKQNIASFLSQLLYTERQALMIEGVGDSHLLRTQACAVDWIDTCERISNDDRLVALALLRLCVKFELSGQCRDVVLKHIGAGVDAMVVHDMEWTLLGRLQTRSQPMCFDDVLQPLAWDPHRVHDGDTSTPSVSIS